MRKSARRRRGRRRSGRGAGGLLWGILIATVLSIVGLGYYLFVGLQDGLRTDSVSLCKEPSGPGAVMVIVLDTSDPLSTNQTSRLRLELERLVANAPSNTMISVGVVSYDEIERGHRFGLCKPLQGEEANALYQNPSLIAERYENGFRKPFRNVINEMLLAEEQNKSPIIESITATIAQTLGVRDAQLPKSLILVSDLYQNSDEFSFYRGDSWNDFKRSTASSNLSKALQGFDVIVIRVPRDPPAQSSAEIVDDFWVRYFSASGVQSVTPDTITLGRL